MHPSHTTDNEVLSNDPQFNEDSDLNIILTNSWNNETNKIMKHQIHVSEGNYLLQLAFTYFVVICSSEIQQAGTTCASHAAAAP